MSLSSSFPYHRHHNKTHHYLTVIVASFLTPIFVRYPYQHQFIILSLSPSQHQHLSLSSSFFSIIIIAYCHQLLSSSPLSIVAKIITIINTYHSHCYHPHHQHLSTSSLPIFIIIPYRRRHSPLPCQCPSSEG